VTASSANRHVARVWRSRSR